MIRILIVDDHVSSREALAFLLDHQDDMQVVAEASSLASASTVRHNIDAAIVDLYLPDGRGTDLIRELKSIHGQIHCILLTAKDDRVAFAQALEAGADGALHKSVRVQEIIVAIRKMSAGEPVHSPRDIMDILHYAGRYREAHGRMQNLFGLLTPRERELLQALADGLSDREIASRMSISVRTVQTHVANILGKLGMDSRIQALVNAARLGVVTIRDS